jgi:hypothetical protein
VPWIADILSASARSALRPWSSSSTLFALRAQADRMSALRHAQSFHYECAHQTCVLQWRTPS